MTPSTEGRIAATAHNRAAGRVIARARMDYGSPTQGEFGNMIAKRLGVPISQSAVSGWEVGARAVPAAVLIAVAEIAGADNVFELGVQEVARLNAFAARGERLGVLKDELDAAIANPKKGQAQRIAALAKELQELVRTVTEEG